MAKATVSRGVSKKCEHCGKVKRCRMFMEEREITRRFPGEPSTKSVLVYLCSVCMRELGWEHGKGAVKP
jgi:hypothetical protein